MELKSIVGYFLGKTILVTGATGFLAMVFVEKILRIQPNVKKIYLLIRAPDTKSATARMNDEIIGKELFKVLREKWGAKFDTFVSEKVVPIPGDVSFEHLGVNEFKLREELCNEVEIILNSAGTTNFDERYDIALAVNTFGVQNVLSFAQKCLKLEIMIHVSTAYVCGQRAGKIPEDTSCTDNLVKETSKFDLQVVEKKLMEEKLDELNAQDASEKVITATMKDFGIERTIDGVIAGYWKGRLECLLMDPMSVIDMIPVDMLVNAIILATVAKANKSSSCKIYQVGSSFRNPVNFSKIHGFCLRYFSANPWINKEGEAVKGLKFVNTAFGQYFENTYVSHNQKLKLAMRMVELYEPYMLFKGFFDDTNTEELRRITRESFIEAENFSFDPKCIDWEDYVIRTHIPGLHKHVLMKRY